MKRSREPDDEVSGYRTSSLGDDAAIDHNSSSAICSRESSSAAAPPPAVKIVQLDPESSRAQEQLSAVPPSVMKCSLPPHKEGLSFPSYEEYEAHYHKAHTNRCLECRKNFPSEHLLVVHIEECHDSLAAVRRERGEHTNDLG
ncbi:hypothetical protein MKZ38_003406 [Zalerion maritima]|uniref:C2H2-type domain-containing protein n=1 Tax=Zalerion maritima TaxID=339359 RepID=A0AAD5RP70_9PEZI|nr:hypothetical protein MKZ38_003406 [Zalerion maritima]